MVAVKRPGAYGRRGATQITLERRQDTNSKSKKEELGEIPTNTHTHTQTETNPIAKQKVKKLADASTMTFWNAQHK